MTFFRIKKTLSSKVFFGMSLVALVILAIMSYSLVMVSGNAAREALEQRHVEVSGCISEARVSINGDETTGELAVKFEGLRIRHTSLESIEIMDSESVVIVSVSGSDTKPEKESVQESTNDNDKGMGHESFTLPLRVDLLRSLRLGFSVVSGSTLSASVVWKIIALTGASLFVIFVFFYGMIYYLVKKPVRQLLEASRVLATNAGDLTAKINIDSDDELGRLGSTLNDMFSNISGIINVIRTTSDKVNFSAQSLSASTEQMNSITEETSLTVQNIAKSTDLQAQKVEDTITEIRNMERSVKQVANSAELAASAATNASETALKGGNSAKEAVDKINAIVETTAASAVIIRHLGERSNQIGEIIDVITDIADQTNMLALNAAIEAARAGEAGRGFAVVADEVKKLAEGSSKAAEEIAALIRKTQEDTQTAVQSIELGSKEVIEGKEVITRTGESLDEIVEVLKSSSDMARRISAATKELSRGMQNVISSVDEISTSAEKNASSTQETAASMEQMTSSMEDVASSAQKLSDMAIQLREHVGRFKISMIDKVDEVVTAT